MNRGQSSVELLLLLAVSMVVIIAIFSYSQQSLRDMDQQRQMDIAQQSVNRLRDAVNDVYAQGVGAKKTILFVVPNDVTASLSGVMNGNSIVLHVIDSDVYALTNATLLGNIPTESGGYEIVLTAFENYVKIGTANLDVNKSSSYVTLQAAQSTSDSILVTNVGTQDANVTLSTSWSPTDVNLNVSPTTFSLTANQSQVVSITYSANASAGGSYTGSLLIMADFVSDDDENISLPLSAEVLTNDTNTSKLLLFPATIAYSAQSNDVDVEVIQACNDDTSTLSNIVFSNGGTIASWISSIATIASLSAGSCTDKNVTITVPPAQSAGVYTGTITGTDNSGSGSNTDLITLSITISAVISELYAYIDFVNDGGFVFTWLSSNTFSGNNGKLGINGELDRNYLNTGWNTNLMGYWKFNNATSGVVQNSSGTDHNATAVSGATILGEGLFDTNAATFNGTSQHFQVNQHVDFNLSDDLTIQGWFYSTSLTPTVGDINDGTIDFLEFDPSTGQEPDMVRLGENSRYVAIAYAGPSADGFIRTVGIDPNGNVDNSSTDVLEYDTSNGQNNDLIKLGPNFYAIAYTGPSGDGFVKTIQIGDNNGDIATAATDTLEFDTADGTNPDIFNVGTNMYAIAYTGTSGDGFIKTFTIFDSNGDIGAAVTDTLEYDTADGATPSVINVQGNMYAVAHIGSSSDLMVKTVRIDTNGDIAAAITETVTFDAGTTAAPSILRVNDSNYYGIAYQSSATTGTLISIYIDYNGDIANTLTDSLVFDSSNVVDAFLFEMGSKTYGITYTGAAGDGFIATATIDTNGEISNSVVDVSEFLNASVARPRVVYMGNDIFAIAHGGVGSDGFVSTVGITRNKGVYREDAYGIDMDLGTGKARGFINDQLIMADINSGWNFITLTFDNDLGSAQQKLYVNGIQRATNNYTADINRLDKNILIGKSFNGKIDELAIFNIARTATQISADYNNAFAGYFDGNVIDASVNDTNWAYAKITGTIDGNVSCADLNYRAGNSAPTDTNTTASCLSTSINTSIQTTLGRYLKYRLVLRNDVNGRQLATPYVNDLNITYYQ